MEGVVKYKLLKPGLVDSITGYMYKFGKMYFFDNQKEIEYIFDDLKSAVNSDKFQSDDIIYEVLFYEDERGYEKNGKIQNVVSISVQKEVSLKELIKIYIKGNINEDIRLKLKRYIYDSPFIRTSDILEIVYSHTNLSEDYLDIAKCVKTRDYVLHDIFKETKDFEVLLEIYKNKNVDSDTKKKCALKIKKKFNNLFSNLGTKSFDEEEFLFVKEAIEAGILDNKKIKKKFKPEIHDVDVGIYVEEQVIQILEKTTSISDLEFNEKLKRLIKHSNVSKKTLMFIIENYDFRYFFAELLENPNITKEMLNKILEKEKWKVSYPGKTIDKILKSESIDLEILNKLKFFDNFISFIGGLNVLENKSLNESIFRWLLTKRVYNTDEDHEHRFMSGILSSKYFNAEVLEKDNAVYSDYKDFLYTTNSKIGFEDYIYSKTVGYKAFKFEDFLYILISLKVTPVEYLYALIKNPGISDFILGHILDILNYKLNAEEINNKEIVLSIIGAEKKMVERMIQNQSIDSELPPLEFKKEYYKVLSKYLGSNKPQVNLLILKEMYKEGCISQKVIDGFYDEGCISQNVMSGFYDEGYIFECKRNLKLCRALSNIIKNNEI